jgi:signal transduction histidine kinase
MVQPRMTQPMVHWLTGLPTSVVLVAAVTGLIHLLEPTAPALGLLVIYMLAVLPVAIVWGTGLAAITSILSAAVAAYVFIPPTSSFQSASSQNAVALGAFLVTAVVMGGLASRLRRTSLESARLTEEQSALRRVATLVAQPARPSAIFEAVTREVGLLCGADLARMERYEDDDTVTGVAVWSTVPVQLAVGTRFDLNGLSLAREIRQTGGPARVDTFRHATGAIAREAREVGIRSSIGCPVVVAGRLWGVIAASTKSEKPFPAGTESQITSFTELVATAVENVESRIELAASRARVIAAVDESRRRLVRDLDDGIQQRLVPLALELRLAQGRPDLPELQAVIGRAAEEITHVVEEVHELSRGIHPVILSTGGLGGALRTLARRSKLPVELDIRTTRQLPEPVKVAVYCAVSEALTNTAKHAADSTVRLVIEERDENLLLSVRDDGPGGADPSRGSGLVGLRDRVESLGGSIDISSPPGQGTLIAVSLPTTRIGEDEEDLHGVQIDPKTGLRGFPPQPPTNRT